MKNWTIQRRVLFIALLPAALIALLLSGYHAHTRVSELEARTLDRARTAAARLAPMAREHLLAGERAQLQELARTALAQDPALSSVTIHDGADSTVAKVAREGALRIGTETLRVQHPVAGIAVPPAAGAVYPPAATDAAAGRVVLTVDFSAARRAQRVVLLESLGIAGLALAFTALVAVRIGRTVTGPVQDLTQVVNRFRCGDHTQRPRLQSGGELGSLERGVLALTNEIEATQSTLRERVDEATRELQHALKELENRNAELEASHSEAEAASEFKSRFLANISHEIRTPMNSILGFTELLSRTDLDPVHMDYLVTIQNSAQSLLSLLNGILDLSKIESGHMQLEYADTNINELLFETFHLLAPQAFSKGIEFIVTPVPASVAAMRVDGIRLQQVLINLASNAVKFTDDGHVRISTETTVRADGGIGLTFRFEDTGRGIPLDAQARLFQAFAQGENARADERLRPAGTGLGLHIASEIVFLMDGLIEFSSEPGVGSTFWFRLELEPARSALPSAPASAPRRSVLLLDPDPGTAAAHSDLLAAAGIDAHAATSSAPSPAADPSLHDAVLVHVPARRLADGDIASLPSALVDGNVPVFAFAYAHGPEPRTRLCDAGFAHVIQKTPEPDALRAALERALGHDPHTASSVAPAATPAIPEDAAPRKVLLVDDQPLNLKLLESYLEETPYRATAAANSGEALYHARLTRFDAILMDIHLPERDGIETTRLLRAPEELNARTPIIAVTADAFADQAFAALSAGMNDILVKPVGRTELLARLAEWCSLADPDISQPGVATEDRPAGLTVLPLFDRADAVSRAGGRADVAEELFAMLQRNLPESLEEVTDACARGDADAVRSAAHRLRGAAAYCGVPRLQQDCASVERIARTDAPEYLGPAVAELAATIEALLALTPEFDDRSSAFDSARPGE